ncbi:hypothetical protein LOF14_00415 [Klebsiella variicola subsp. variicola]|nr:hypothetical protein LOF14_00415 [Klebsiella variicola subsp. variicola]
MSNFVLRINAVSNDTTMPVIDAADLSFNELPPVESDAWEFFALDGTDSSLAGTLHSRSLTKQNTVISGDNFFTLAIGSNVKNALVSTFCRSPRTDAGDGSQVSYTTNQCPANPCHCRCYE